MSSEPTNADIYGVLLGIKEDIGGLKVGQGLQLEGLKSHSGRIAALESIAQRQKGAAKVWMMVGSGVGAVIGGASAMLAAWLKH